MPYFPPIQKSMYEETEMFRLRLRAIKLLRKPSAGSEKKLYGVLIEFQKRAKFWSILHPHNAYWSEQNIKLQDAALAMHEVRILRDSALRQQVFGPQQSAVDAWAELNHVLDEALQNRTFLFEPHPSQEKGVRLFKHKQQIFSVMGISRMDVWSLKFDARLSRRAPRAVYAFIRRPLSSLGL